MELNDVILKQLKTSSVLTRNSKNGGALVVTPVRACVRPSIRPSEIWCPLNNF